MKNSVNIDGYQASTVNLNSPEIMKLAYGKEMNDHVAKIKKSHKEKSDFNNRENMQFGKEVADIFRGKAVERVVTGGRGDIKIIRMKPRFCFMCEGRAHTAFVINGKTYCEYHRGHYRMTNVDRRLNGLKQDPDLLDYQPSIKPKGNRSTKE